MAIASPQRQTDPSRMTIPYVVLASGSMFGSLVEEGLGDDLDVVLIICKYHSRHVENPARNSSLLLIWL